MYLYLPVSLCISTQVSKTDTIYGQYSLANSKESGVLSVSFSIHFYMTVLGFFYMTVLGLTKLIKIP